MGGFIAVKNLMAFRLILKLMTRELFDSGDLLARHLFPNPDVDVNIVILSSYILGMEVTDEGDITFYAEQKIDATDDKCASRIDRMISCFINMISEVPLALAL